LFELDRNAPERRSGCSLKDRNTVPVHFQLNVTERHIRLLSYQFRLSVCLSVTFVHPDLEYQFSIDILHHLIT